MLVVLQVWSNFDEPFRLSTHAKFNSLNQPYDAGNIAGIVSRLSREEKFQALNNLYKPPSTFVFPQHTEGSGSPSRINGRLTMPGLHTQRKIMDSIVSHVFSFLKTNV